MRASTRQGRYWLGPTLHSNQTSVSAARNLLLAWYGSFDGHGTIGDLLSVTSVARYLTDIGHHVFHASAEEFAGIQDHRVDWRLVTPRDFDALIFVCGPIIKHHPLTGELFQKFQEIHRIGVGVSLLPAGHFNHFDPFDFVLAREGKPEVFEDIAIVAPMACGARPQVARSRDITIGVALRGAQTEYGPELCLSEPLQEIVANSIRKILDQHGGRSLLIENHLRRSEVLPDEIEAQYRGCDLVITSRFHGAMLAVRHSIPFIAIDQIKGGAKVLKLVGATGWPYVFPGETVSAERIVESANHLISGGLRERMVDIRAEAIGRAEDTLARLNILIERAVPISNC